MANNKAIKKVLQMLEESVDKQSLKEAPAAGGTFLDKLKWQPSAKRKGYEFASISIPIGKVGTVAGLAAKFRTVGITLPPNQGKYSYEAEFAVPGYKKPWRIYTSGGGTKSGSFVIQRPVKGAFVPGEKKTAKNYTIQDIANLGDEKIYKLLTSAIKKLKLDKGSESDFLSFCATSFGRKGQAKLILDPAALRKEWDDFNNYDPEAE